MKINTHTALLILMFFWAMTTHAQKVGNMDGDNYAFPFAGGMNSMQFGAIDMNMDGIKDLLAFDRHGDRLMPFINGGTAGEVDYITAPEFISSFPEIRHWIILTDYNMDGKEDIFTYNAQIPGIIVYKNTSSSTELRFERVVYPYLTSWYGSGYVNILVTYADYPGIADLDGDGDLDILTFWALGSFVEMHQNLSMETYGHADSLIFERTTSCWGEFAENEESNILYLDTCFGRDEGYMMQHPARDRHTGSTLLLRDLNNDGTMELLLGDVDYPQLVFLLNDGTPEYAHMASFELAYPNQNHPAWVYSMPAAATIDVNNDGLDDLLASPFDPNPFVTQNHRSVFLYLNSGSNEIPQWNYSGKGFLQENMIDLGSGAYPAFADINLDGLQDLIIGNWGYYQSSWYDESMTLHSEYSSRMAIFMNDGEPDEPRFEFITDNFGFISEMDILGTYPAFGDIDTDDDADMIVGRDDGTLLFYRNCSCLGNPEDFALEDTNYQDIDVGDYSTPFIFDLDEDGLLDLIIGEKAGNLNFYRNTGDIYNPQFTLVTDSLGKINVTNYNLSYDGFSSPYIFRGADGLIRLVSGSEQGTIFAFKGIEGNLEGSFPEDESLWMEIDTNEFTIRKGYRTSAALADLNGDGYLEMAVGNFSGGIELYSTMNAPEVSMDIAEQDISDLQQLILYPNPASGIVQLKSEVSEDCLLQLYHVSGRLVFEERCEKIVNPSFSVAKIPNGLYICVLRSLSNDQPKSSGKLIIQH